jgi:biotin-(acetyl-CoA carboxylase) ligase
MATETKVRWTDIAHVLNGAAPDRNTVVEALIKEVVKMCRQCQYGASMLLDELELALSALNDREVCVRTEPGDRITGRVLGISATGELRVSVDGQERCFSSADVSLTGIDARPEADETDVDD